MFNFNPFELTKTISASSNTDPQDVLKAKNALSQTGHYEMPSFGLTDMPDRPLIDGIKKFQQNNGLKVDGIMKPKGPTEKVLNLKTQFLNPSKPLMPTKEKPKTKQPRENISKPDNPFLALIPQGNTVSQRIQSLMTDPRYQDKNDASLRDHVVKQFEKAYPGNVEYDETGKMIQPKAVIQPDEVEPFDPEGELVNSAPSTEPMILTSTTKESRPVIAAQMNEQEAEEKTALDPSYEQKVPVLKNEGERLYSIVNDTPAKFNIEKNPDASGEERLHEIGWVGSMAVSKHSDTIEKIATKHGIEPDMLKALMWAENARGHKFSGNYIADWLQKSDSALPMNMNKETGAKLLDKAPDDMYDAENNIEAAAIFLKRLQDRTENPTPEKLGAMWVYTGREKTNDWGAFVQRVYDTKPWEQNYNNEHGPEKETYGP